jgi:hypothetical protein
MSTLTNTTGFLSETQRPAGSIFGKIRTVVSALSEARAAANHYETLVAQGLSPGEASKVVFRTHFGQR